jgi:hypothetical protein
MANSADHEYEGPNSAPSVSCGCNGGRPSGVAGKLRPSRAATAKSDAKVADLRIVPGVTRQARSLNHRDGVSTHLNVGLRRRKSLV